MTHQFSQFNQYCDNNEECLVLEAYAEDCKRDAENYKYANAFILDIIKRHESRS